MSLPSNATTSAALAQAVFRCCFVLFLACKCTALSAQENAAWQVMRVNIPVDEVPKLTSQAYEAKRIDELEAQLEAEAERRRVALMTAPYLSDATYIARLENDSIVSERSRWIFSGRTTGQPFRIHDVSLALERAIGNVPEAQQFVDYQAVTPEGTIELELPGERGEYWFGFSMRSNAETAQTFRFDLPVATSARMLIATPLVSELQSEEVVVEHVSNPLDYLPGDFPSANALLGDFGQQWWLVHLSGTTHFTLSVRNQAATIQSWFKHTLRSSRVDYVARELDESSQLVALDVAAVFNFVADTSHSALRLRSSRQLRVSSILVNGLNANWRVLSSQDGNFDLLEIEGFADSQDVSTIEVTASCDHLQNSILPEIAISESYSVAGSIRLFTNQDIQVDTVLSQHAEIKFAQMLPAESQGDARLRASADWIGAPPTVEVAFGAKISKWTARSLTRFSVQSDWLSANCRIRLNADDVDENEVHIDVGKGWFVDQVKLVDALESGLRAEFFERGNEQEPITDVVVSWQGRLSKVAIELDVAAHRPLQTDEDRLRLITQRLLTIPDADQIDNYSIEPSGRYQVEVGAGLLLFQLQPVDLPFWQQQLLSQQTKRWIFQGLRSSIPPIYLVATRGSYSARLTTLVLGDPDSNVRQVLRPQFGNYRIQVEPMSNPIESLTVALPEGLDPDSLNWSLESGFDATSAALQQTFNNDKTSLELRLPEARDSTFTIGCRFQLKEEPAETAIPVIGIPEAASCESTLIIPQAFSRFRSPDAIDLLPADYCQADKSLVDLLDTVDVVEIANLVAARLDGKSSQWLRIEKTDQRLSPSWIWSESIEHFVDGRGSRSHIVKWQIESGGTPGFEARLPTSWRVVRATLNGASHRVARLPGATVAFDIAERQSASIELQCVSTAARSSWLYPEKLQKPITNSTLLIAKHVLHVPPSFIPLQRIPNTRPVGKLVDRLNPRSWWIWMRSSPSMDEVNNRRAGWTTIELSSSVGQGSAALEGEIWLVNRSAFAAMSMSCCLGLSLLFYLAFLAIGRITWMVFAAILVGLIVVPNAWVGLLQLILLSAAMAALLRMFQVVFVILRGNRQRRGESRTLTNSSIIRATSLGLVCLLFDASQAQLRQFPVDSLPVFDTSQARSELFGVLIPVAEDGAMVGEYAYVPSALNQLLSAAQGENRPTGGRLLSANYTLRISPATTVDRKSVQFLAAEFRVVFYQPYDELHLPIKRKELPLSRCEVNGQTDYELVNQNQSSVTFRAGMPGIYSLKLIFNPEIELDENDHAQLRAQIPVVPSARISIVSEKSTEVELDSIGRQLKSENMLSATLGPSREINCRWYSSNSSSANLQPVRASSRLWVSAHSDQLVATGMLQIENPGGLPNPFRIVIDDSWEPIGMHWGDVELISPGSLLGNRRFYDVRFRRDSLAGPQDAATVRLLMAPRIRVPVNTLPAPFLTLEKSGPSVDRTFTWSADDKSRWRPDGLEILPEMTPPPTVDWQDFILAPQFRTYRVPPGSPATNLQRLPPPEKTIVSEVTRVHISVPEAKIVYSVKSEQPIASDSGLRFLIPLNSRIEYVRANDAEAGFEVLRRDAQEVLVVVPANGGKVYGVDLELSYPTFLSSPSRASRTQPMGRVVMLGTSADSSVVRILRTAGLKCELKTNDESLIIRSVVARPFDLLVNLEALVGQVDLEDRFRESAYLPLDFVLSRRRDLQMSGSVLYIDHNDSGWQGRLDAQWTSSDEQLDFLFFDIPASLRETIDTGSLPRRFIPMGDPERVTLCLLPPKPVDGRTRIQLTFPLVFAGSQQSLDIPRIQLLSLQQDQVSSPAIALPNTVDNQACAWETGNIRLLTGWTDPLNPKQQNAFTYIQPTPEKIQVAWELSAPTVSRAEVQYSNLALLSVSSESVVGYVDYWIRPHGQLKFLLRLPNNAQVIGTSLGHRSAITSASEDGLFSVLLQPNYLPLHVRVFMRWELSGPESSVSLPELVNSDETGQLRTIQGNRTGTWEVALSDISNSQTAEVAERWAKTLGGSLAAAAGLSLPEREAWLSGWHPKAIGLNSNLQIPLGTLTGPVALSGPAAAPGPLNSATPPAAIDIVDFWTSTCQQLQVDPARVDKHTENDFEHQLLASQTNDVRLRTHDTIQFNRLSPPSSLLSRLLAAVLVFLVVLLAVRVVVQLREPYLQLLSAFPWIYWLQLAIFTWILLPAYWPGCVLALTAFGMSVGQLLDYRRTNHLR